MTDKLIPVVKAEEAPEEEEDLVDPKEELKVRNYPKKIEIKSVEGICHEKPEAQKLWSRYQECNDRVNSRSKTSETCEEELFDYLHVVDSCVVKDLFNRLK